MLVLCAVLEQGGPNALLLAPAPKCRTSNPQNDFACLVAVLHGQIHEQLIFLVPSNPTLGTGARHSLKEKDAPSPAAVSQTRARESSRGCAWCLGGQTPKVQGAAIPEDHATKGTGQAAASTGTSHCFGNGNT